VIDFTTNTSGTAERSVVASCLLSRHAQGTGVAGVIGLLGRERIGNERPTSAPAAVAAAQAVAYASAFAANGAGVDRQKKQHLTMWAFRGLEPWRDPA
jgi:hypothetical protein